MIREASKFGHVIVIVNSDDWLMRKKGYIFMPFEERCEIIQGFTATGTTTFVDDSDGTVCEALHRIKPDYFANGGDRKTDNTPEMDVCEKLDIEMLWSIGGGKIQSSSTLVTDAGLDPVLLRMQSYSPPWFRSFNQTIYQNPGTTKKLYFISYRS